MSDQEKLYKIWVADNFHYMDSSEQYSHGEYWTQDEAEAECRRMVEADLRHLYTLGMSSKELYERYMSFGEDPHVIGGTQAEPRFSAWNYAKARCEVICADQRSEA